MTTTSVSRIALEPCAIFRAVVKPLAISLVALSVTTAVSAQAWRGMGRVSGKITDEAGQPIEGVVVKASLPGQGGTDAKTNKKGEWAIGGIAHGEWQVDFEKPGFETRRISVSVSEVGRNAPVEISLKKAAVDANVEIRDGVLKGAELMNQKNYAEARAIYETLLAKYPQAHQLHPLIARAYYGENQYDKAIEHLKMAVEKDPANVEVKLLLGNVLMEKGDAEEGKKILSSVDETLVKDPTIFVNVGIVLLNQNKPAEAKDYFTRAITHFPQHADAYYYRGITALQMGDNQPAKADLEKFIELAPDAPEAATAKKILEQLK